MYRVKQDLSWPNGTVTKRGSLLPSKRFSPKAAAKLVQVGAIVEVAPPPLAILPGWTTRAKRLEKLGVITVTDFIEGGDEQEGEIKRLFRIRPETLESWKAEVSKWLTVSESNC